MVVNKIAVCPICEKRTWLRIEDGSYLNEYPIRINCINCRALLKGMYVMTPNANSRGLTMINAKVEECNVDSTARTVHNADYIAEISGELPCSHVAKYQGGIPNSPFLKAVSNLKSIEDRKARLKYFTRNMEEWKATKSIAFQLLDDGSIDYIAIALKGKLGEYTYKCDHYLKSLHCLQEVVLEVTRYLFLTPEQDDSVTSLINNMAQIDGDKLHSFAVDIGGIEDLIRAYRKSINIVSDFMNIYPHLLPAETFIRFKNKNIEDNCISTCSFSDIKTFYQDAYESLLSILYIPVGLDNIHMRNDHNSFDSDYDKVKCGTGVRDLGWYRTLDNGTRINKLNVSEYYQHYADIPANRLLRNGIGHNNIKYDGITQKVTAFDLKKPDEIKAEIRLMDMAIDCLGLARSAVILSEMILFLLRREFKAEGIRTIIHPRFYKNAEPNIKCPCGSGIKYKKCCRSEIEELKTI